MVVRAEPLTEQQGVELLPVPLPSVDEKANEACLNLIELCHDGEVIPIGTIELLCPGILGQHDEVGGSVTSFEVLRRIAESRDLDVEIAQLIGGEMLTFNVFRAALTYFLSA
ncbi:hypothetical protein Poly41_48100 [Novipirellula artificiosorum]|uniref:Uncharacterized protein n=1 Tax=Novipirellula artificiosorum TaxID=2528016 RepID=A0A5C6DDN6_9BACT|nr:hypothetical protein Poly41_48100 [Novipirellula artificiosorum]